LLPFAPITLGALAGAVMMLTQGSGVTTVAASDRPHRVVAPSPAASVTVKGARSTREAAKVPIPKKRYLRDACKLPPRWVRSIDRGWVPGPVRDTDIVLVPRPPSYVGTTFNASHSGPYDFLQKVPLVFYGPGVIEPQGMVDVGREVTLADLAPTQASMLGFDMRQQDGRPIKEVVPDSARPKLLVTASIDGGGWNVLERWPRSWPFLSSLIEGGVGVAEVSAGSSPSITPAIHTTMSTGAWPREHGVTGIAIRKGQNIVGAFSSDDSDADVPVEPRLNLRSKTLADKWDLATGNRAKAGLIASGNFPIGFLGQGAALDHGDKDFALIAKTSGDWATDRRFYSMPRWASHIHGRRRDRIAMDATDGKRDGKWRGHDVLSTQIGFTPADAARVARTATTMLAKEGFGRDSVTDLLYVHFKSPDHVSHRWNMIAREMSDVLASVDTGLKTLTAWLDANVGYGNYVLTVTADHGLTPLDRGGWAINRPELLDDVRERFDRVNDDEGIVTRTSATSLFTNAEEMKVNGTSPEEVSSFLSRYRIGDNIAEGIEPPRAFRQRLNERIFKAVFPGRSLPLISRCAQAG
jgi:predicted AlkP superfamily pyrophosphatase or phosphodiesterase